MFLAVIVCHENVVHTCTCICLRERSSASCKRACDFCKCIYSQLSLHKLLCLTLGKQAVISHCDTSKSMLVPNY